MHTLGNRSSTPALRVVPLLLVSVLVSACSDDHSTDDTRAATMAWSACDDEPILECGTLVVPLIHAAPDGRTITLDMIRLPATGSTDVEPLLMNPGGPGGSGTELIRHLADADSVPAAVRRRFDLVGFDPRGLGNSSPVDCSELDTGTLDAYLLNRQEIEALVASSTRSVDACVDRHGDVLQWLGSNSVVQDMEHMRVALGADVLNFLGYSYGTRLAALYLQRYPQVSGRMILDGSVLPDGRLEPLVRGQVLGFQRNLDRALEGCGTRVPECDPDTLDASLDARIGAILSSQDETAFELFGTLLLLVAQEPMLGDIAGPSLLRYTLDGDIRVLQELADLLDTLGVSLDDSDSSGDGLTVQRAVLCADDPARPTVDELATLLPALDAVSNVFAEALLPLAASCSGWPAALDPVAAVAVDTAPLSLVIGGTSDAQTLPEWAPLMAAAVGGQVLVSEHLGHTVVFQQDSRCVDDAAAAFLLEGTRPSTERCTSEQAEIAYW